MTDTESTPPQDPNLTPSQDPDLTPPQDPEITPPALILPVLTPSALTSPPLILPADCPPGPPRAKAERLELLVFLLLLMPSMALGLLSHKPGVWLGSVGFRDLALMSILQDLALICLVQYFRWRNGDSLASLGWTLRRGWLDGILAFVLFIPYMWLLWLVMKVLVAVGLAAPSSVMPTSFMAHGREEYLLATLLVVVIAVAEETIFRGYLLLRLRSVTSSRLVAVAVAAFIFALGHGYQGLAGMLATGVVALIFSLLYFWRGSLLLPVGLHFLHDFYALVVFPLLRMKFH